MNYNQIKISRKQEVVIMFCKLIEQKKVLLYGTFIFLFLYFFQFMGLLNRISLLGAGIFYFFYVYTGKRLNIDIRDVLLGFTLLLYGYLANFSFTDMVSAAALPVLLSLISKYVVTVSADKAEKRIWLLLTVFLLGFSLHGILNSILYFKLGFTENMGRVWKDIWTGLDLRATHQNVYVIPVLALLFPAFLFFKKHKTVCSLLILTNIFFMIYSISSFSRIPVLICGILLIWEFILFVLLNRKNRNLFTYLKYMGLAAAVCAVLAIIFCLRFRWWEDSALINTLARGGGIFHNIRFKAQMNALRQLFTYPWGGYHMDFYGLEFCHNVWLDMANASGIVPFFLLILYTIISAIDIVKLLINPFADIKLKYVLSGLYFAFLLYFMIEPALMANINFFTPWTYLNGIVLGYNSLLKVTAR